MTKLTKKLTAALLALIATLCLAFGVFLAVPRAASAATAETLNSADDFIIDNGVFKGIQDGAVAAGKQYRVEIPAGVTSIAGTTNGYTESLSGVFGNYSNQIVSITIPTSVTEIGQNAFVNCKNVTEVNYYATNATGSTSSPFRGIGNATVTIGNGSDEVTLLYSYLFRNTDIATVTLHKVVTDTSGFGQHIFDGCKKLVKVEFDSNCSLVILKNDAFNGCLSLAAITLPAVKTIDADAFNNCQNLAEITIPSSVEEIKAGAFTSCTGLLEVVNNSDLTINTGNGIAGSTGLSIKNVVTDGAATKFSDVRYSYNNKDYTFRFYTDGSSRYLVRYTGEYTDVYLPQGVVSNYIINNGAFRNTDITSVHIPSGVLEIQENAFRECASLTSVTFEDLSSTGISVIKDSVFYGCASLEEIELPASVVELKAHAFSDCTSLKNVKFNSYTVNDVKTYKLDIIDSAFENCTGLTEFTIPYTVRILRSNAFANCRNLKKLYLPESATVDAASFVGCTGTQFIAPNKASYDNSYSKYSTQFSVGELVYLINYKLHYGEKSYEVSQINTLGLPAWNGYGDTAAYSKSVWYKTATDTTPVDFDTAVNGLTNQTIELYSKVMEKPAKEDFKVKQVSFEESSIDIATRKGNIFSAPSSENLDKYEILVSNYRNMDGDQIEVTDKTQLTDAGTYALSVNIKDKTVYGEWAEGVIVTVKVSPMQLDSVALEWGVRGSGNAISNLSPAEGTITLYKYDGDETYYKEKQLVGGVERPHEQTSKDGDYETVILKSYVDYVGDDNALTIAIKGYYDANYSKYFVAEPTYSNNVQAKLGKYDATATFRLTNNYRFATGSDMGGLANQGITVDFDDYFNTYSVTKTWYIVANDVNSLIDAETNAIFTISGWQYDRLTTPAEITAPKLANGNDEIGAKVVYTLNMYEAEDAAGVEGGLIKAVTFSRDKFGKVINTSMPAGYYVLTASIPNYTAGSTTIAGREQIISFTVSKATSDSILGTKDSQGNIIKEGLIYGGIIPNNGTALYADYNSERPVAQLGDVKTIIPVLGLKPEQLHPSRSTISGNEWAKEEYDKFYTEFKITYRLTGGLIYRDENDEEFTNKPIDIGDYVVYYNVSAPSYDDTYNSTNNFYRLYIRGVIEPAVRTVSYTGSHISVSETDYYEVIYLDDSTTVSRELRQALGVQNALDYVNVGTYPIVLRIKDRYANTARWKSDNNGLPINGNYGDRYFAYNLAIVQANNIGTQTPTLLSWEWGAYDEKVNVPHWATRFPTEFNFILRSVENPINDNEYYWKPTGSQKGFGEAPAGEYYLVPIAVGDTNVKGFIATTGDQFGSVTVLQATITWVADKTPFINSWKYGDDATGFAVPTGTLNNSFTELEDAWTVCIVRESDYAKLVKGEEVTTYANLQALQNGNGGLAPAGNYVYVYHLEETKNYEEWYYPVYFSVIIATNYWDIAPVINNWAYGDYTSIDNTYRPHFGDVKGVLIEVCEVDEDNKPLTGMGSIRELLDERGQLPMGRYGYRAVLEGTANYTRLVFENVYFEVLKAENSWVEIPQIIGWSEGRFNSKDDAGVSNKPLAEARFGNVYFTVISDETGDTVISKIAADLLNYETLNKLAVGSYTLLAEVEGTVNYSGLSSEAHFAVFEDSVGLAGLIASTMVFAVIAVGLAVAGVVLLIRRNRKIEQEFRKMVKTELRRK